MGVVRDLRVCEECATECVFFCLLLPYLCSQEIDGFVSNRALTLARTVYSFPFLPSPDFTYRFHFFLSHKATEQHQHRLLDECEHLYEGSLWCLYALMLQDDFLQNGNLLLSMEEDREKIATCRFFTRSGLTIWLTHIHSRWGNRDQATKLRRVRCRMRMPCTESLFFSFFLPPDIDFFNQIDFDCPRLARFIISSTQLEHSNVPWNKRCLEI